VWNIKISFIFPLSLSCDAYTNCILKCRMITIYYRKIIRCKTMRARNFSVFLTAPLWPFSRFFHRHFLIYVYIHRDYEQTWERCNVIAIKSGFICWFLSQQPEIAEWKRFLQNYCTMKLNWGSIRINSPLHKIPVLYFKFEITQVFYRDNNTRYRA